MIEKRRKRNKLSIVLILFYLFTVTLVVAEFSMARYKTSVAGVLSASAATWNFKVNSQSQTFNVLLNQTVEESDVYAYERNVIAPSAQGSFDLLIDCTGSNVPVEYEIDIIPTPGIVLPTEMYVYTLDENNSKTSVLDKIITGSISLADIANNPVKTVTIGWMWQINKDTNESSYENENLSLTIQITGKQVVE